MTTGEKIKKLRKKKMMTQSALVGTEITRNMLSRIENGQANPSLDTLRYLSKRLGVPVGYLLADEKEDLTYEKSFLIAEIRLAYESGDYEICRRLCAESGLDDDEIGLIAAEASFALATEKFMAGRLRTACANFDEAISLSERTSYYTEHIKAAAAMYFRYMRELSPNLYSNIIEENAVEHYCAMSIDFCRYMYAVVGVDGGHTTFARSLISGADKEEPTALHLEAKIDMANKNYRLAMGKLRQILTSKYEVSRPLLYAVLYDLEICCRETNDFKGAYEYSNTKVSLLQKMLSDE